MLLNYSPFRSANFWFNTQFTITLANTAPNNILLLAWTFSGLLLLWLDKAWNICCLPNKDVGEVADMARRNVRGSLYALQLSIPTTCTYLHTRIIRSSVSIGKGLGMENRYSSTTGFNFQVNNRRISASSNVCRFSAKSSKCLASHTWQKRTDLFIF